MRLYPPAMFNMRHCVETTEVAEGVTIEAGTNLLWYNLNFHKDPSIYTNPDKFDPSRWEGNESNTLQDEAWFGFGQGPRACPGVRLAFLFMKMFVIAVMQEYEIIKNKDTPEEIKISMKDLKVVADKPLLFSFKKR